MPRSSSSRAPARAPARAPPPPAPRAQAPPPAPRAQAPPPAPMQQQQQGGGMLSGIGSTIVQGMAFGTGSAIAHRAVGAVFGGSSEQAPQAAAPAAPAVSAPQIQQSSGVCQMDMDSFNRCMKENNNSVSSCDFYFQALQQCQASSRY